MPIYEFSCQKCHGLVELLVKNTKEKIEICCPDCGSNELQRVISRVNSVISDGAGQAGCMAAGCSPQENRSCSSGNCSTLTLPGHTRS